MLWFFTLLYFFPMKLNKTANFVTTEEYTSYSTCYSQNNIFYEYFFSIETTITQPIKDPLGQY